MISCIVGQVVEQFKNHREGIYFDINDRGAELRVFFNNPTQVEVEQFKSGNGFEIRFVELYGVIMFAIKIGNLNWMDAPYTPHLSINLTNLDVLNEKQDLLMTLILVDAVTGEIKYLRLLGLPEKFSRKLFAVMKRQKEKDFDIVEYAKTIERIYSDYSIEHIAIMCDAYARYLPKPQRHKADCENG